MREDTKSSELENEVQDTSDKKTIKSTVKIVWLTSLITCFFITTAIMRMEFSKSNKIRVPLSSFSQSELVDINQKLIAADKEINPNTNTQPDSEMSVKDNIIFLLNKLDIRYNAFRNSSLRFGIYTKVYASYDDKRTSSQKARIEALNNDVSVEFDINSSPEITVFFSNTFIDEADYNADDLVSVGKQTFIYAIDSIRESIEKQRAREKYSKEEEKNRKSLLNAASA